MEMAGVMATSLGGCGESDDEDEGQFLKHGDRCWNSVLKLACEDKGQWNRTDCVCVCAVSNRARANIQH